MNTFFYNIFSNKWFFDIIAIFQIIIIIFNNITIGLYKLILRIKIIYIFDSALSFLKILLYFNTFILIFLCNFLLNGIFQSLDKINKLI